MRGLDGDRAVLDAEVRRELLGVAARVVRRVARRHGHAVDPIGAERVDRDDRHERGVDPARQPDHHVGEAVLLDVVAGAEHQRLVHLLVAAEEVGDRRLPADGGIGGRRGDVGDPGELDQRELLVGRPATRVEEPLAVHRLHVEVDHQQVLDELGRAGEQLAVRVEGDGPTVEDQLVLAADLVHVDERAGRVGGAGGEHPLPLGLLALGVGRGVEVEDHLGAAVGLVGDRARRVPRVLADGHTHGHAGDPVELLGLVPPREVAELVEDRVVRQLALAVDPDDLAAGAHRGRVPEVAVVVHEADHRRTARGGRGDAFEGPLVVGDEAGLQQQVLGRVAGGRQLGEEGDVAALGLGAAQRLEDPLDVAVEVPDPRVDLGGGDTQDGHVISVGRFPLPLGSMDRGRCDDAREAGLRRGLRRPRAPGRGAQGGRAQPGPRHDPGGRGRRFGRLHPHEDGEGRGARVRRQPHPAPGRRHADRRGEGDPGVQRRSLGRRHAPPAPHAAPHRLRRGAGRDRSGQGRRRRPPGEHGPPRPRHGRSTAVHPGRDRGAPPALRDPGGRSERGGARPWLHARPPGVDPPVAEGGGRQRRGHPAAHRRARLGRLHPPRPRS